MVGPVLFRGISRIRKCLRSGYLLQVLRPPRLRMKGSHTQVLRQGLLSGKRLLHHTSKSFLNNNNNNSNNNNNNNNPRTPLGP